MRFFSTGHTREEAEKLMQVWWRYLALPMEFMGILFICISWAIRDWWFFAFGALFTAISLFAHLLIQLVSIDLHICDVIERQEAKKPEGSE